MRRIKEAGAALAGLPARQELEEINALNGTSLRAEEVYAFCLRLCDNQVDRELERFPRETLEELAPLFVGKCGIFDHKWSAHEQVGRIYRTQVVEDPGQPSQTGEPYCYLKAWAYMLRTGENADLIAQIEGGIKKEVSVGCSVAKTVCSICGCELQDRSRCTHVKGKTYDGKLCWADLRQATDAYEWSFVAVPAQPGAGVIKSLDAAGLEDLGQSRPEYRQALDLLAKEARAGRRYLAGLRADVVRLGALVQPQLRPALLRTIAEGLDAGDLETLRKVWQRQADALCPAAPQLWQEGTEGGTGDEVFRI
ncbi:hypothetical protein H7U37_09225 [Pseudoflavonifractor phocaeensis]|uniref:hypothetical protein n=1 Tax=Pseudoflavonifractor phocaeensis TaxID=1870988 RepID=UPI001959C518|nr:hypothetical protein [Pseudoflavonifractor phocaeensis]MBM6870421.1 hypothetical protein [Pseudoflavonifractor phocaeensis]MBM6938703.1 hypothetical protein [Pseudoflavonifractor phocaeensis]